MHISSDREGLRSNVKLFGETSRLISAARNTNNRMQLWGNTSLLYYLSRNKIPDNVTI